MNNRKIDKTIFQSIFETLDGTDIDIYFVFELLKPVR